MQNQDKNTQVLFTFANKSCKLFTNYVPKTKESLRTIP